MNITPTAVFIFVFLIMVTVSVFGGYFELGVEGGGVGSDLPTDMWSLALSSVSFFWSMLMFGVPGLPFIFSVIWWVLSVLAVYSLVKVIWPGA